MSEITCAGCGRTHTNGGNWRHFGQRWLCANCPGFENFLRTVKESR